MASRLVLILMAIFCGAAAAAGDFPVFGQSAERAAFFAAQKDARDAAAEALAEERRQAAEAERAEALTRNETVISTETTIASRPITCRVTDPGAGRSGVFTRETDLIPPCRPLTDPIYRDPYGSTVTIIVGPGGGFHTVFRPGLNLVINID